MIDHLNYLPGLGLLGMLLSSPVGFMEGFGGTTLSGFTTGFSAGTRGLTLGFGFGAGAAAPSLDVADGDRGLGADTGADLGAGAGFETGAGLMGTFCLGGAEGFSTLGARGAIGV